jgi:transcriptional regulator with GAF, ATPase, and Fis domain
MCHYEFGQFQPEIIRNVLRTHPLAIVGEHLYDNVHFEPAALVLGGAELESQRVELMRSRLRSRARREKALADLGRLALDGASPTALMSAVAHLIAAEVQVDAVQVYELLPSGDSLRQVASAGLQPVKLGHIEPIGPESLLASGLMRAGQPLIISDWSQQARFRQPDSLRAAGITSSASLIISIGPSERIYGVLSLHSTEPRIFSEDETVFLETVSISLGHAIARKRSKDELRALVEAGRPLSDDAQRHCVDLIMRWLVREYQRAQKGE